jgi:hypothetical protein
MSITEKSIREEVEDKTRILTEPTGIRRGVASRVEGLDKIVTAINISHALIYSVHEVCHVCHFHTLPSESAPVRVLFFSPIYCAYLNCGRWQRSS